MKYLFTTPKWQSGVGSIHRDCFECLSLKKKKVEQFWRWQKNVMLPCLNSVFQKFRQTSTGKPFQQDGVTPHTSNISMNWLKAHFPDSLISTKSDFPWSQKSPDLNPLKIFLWGYMKEELCKASLASIYEIKENIREFCTSIGGEILSRVTASFSSRIQRYIQANGGPFEQTLNVNKIYEPELSNNVQTSLLSLKIQNF